VYARWSEVVPDFKDFVSMVFETLYGWNLSHYLDDFLFVFPPGTDISPISPQFDDVHATVGLRKAAKKDADGTVVTHLGFEFDTIRIELLRIRYRMDHGCHRQWVLQSVLL
jgi:hypothetical protein